MTKEEIRAAMPQCAAWIDEIRRVFGDESIAAITANERGHEIAWKAKPYRLRHFESGPAKKVSGRSRRSGV